MTQTNSTVTELKNSELLELTSKIDGVNSGALKEAAIDASTDTKVLYYPDEAGIEAAVNPVLAEQSTLLLLIMLFSFGVITAVYRQYRPLPSQSNLYVPLTVWTTFVGFLTLATARVSVFDSALVNQYIYSLARRDQPWTSLDILNFPTINLLDGFSSTAIFLGLGTALFAGARFVFGFKTGKTYTASHAQLLVWLHAVEKLLNKYPTSWLTTNIQKALHSSQDVSAYVLLRLMQSTATLAIVLTAYSQANAVAHRFFYLLHSLISELYSFFCLRGLTPVAELSKLLTEQSVAYKAAIEAAPFVSFEWFLTPIIGTSVLFFIAAFLRCAKLPTSLQKTAVVLGVISVEHAEWLSAHPKTFCFLFVVLYFWPENLPNENKAMLARAKDLLTGAAATGVIVKVAESYNRSPIKKEKTSASLEWNKGNPKGHYNKETTYAEPKPKPSSNWTQEVLSFIDEHSVALGFSLMLVAGVLFYLYTKHVCSSSHPARNYSLLLIGVIRVLVCVSVGCFLLALPSTSLLTPMLCVVFSRSRLDNFFSPNKTHWT